jgi:hypothetical protein
MVLRRSSSVVGRLSAFVDPSSRCRRAVGRLIGSAATAGVVLVLAGCNGGTVDRHALTRDAATLDSIACEGALLAADVARGRTTTYFAREQADVLRVQSSNFADALSRRKALPEIEPEVRAKARHAAALAAVLRQLHDHPSNHALGAVLSGSLKKLGGCS